LTYKPDFAIIQAIDTYSSNTGRYFLKYQKEAKMKGYNGPSILCTVLMFGAVIVSPAFAEMKKVNEADLSGANASVTGASVKYQTVGVENYVVNLQPLPDSEYTNSLMNAYKKASTSMSSSTPPFFLDTTIDDQKRYFGGSTSNKTGGVITTSKFY